MRMEINQFGVNPTGRPRQLTVLCVLSFIGSGAGAFSNLFIFLLHPVFLDAIATGKYDDLGFDLSFFSAIDKAYFLITGLLQVISFSGVVQMWSLRRSGFHLYAIAQLLMLIVSTIYVYKPTNTFPMFDLMFASLFILLYLRFRNIMH